MISNRLKSLTKYIDSTDKIIDIGCDHALLDIYLIKNNIVDNIMVSDVSENALEQGIENINKYNLNDYIEARCGNGLEVLDSNDIINTVIISGMGTNTILNILNNKYLNNINKLVIQSNKDYDLLRKGIVELGFKISAEEVVLDNNKLYLNIVFIRGKECYSDIEIKYGTNKLINKKLYYEYKINKYEKIIDKVNDDIKIKLTNEINILNTLLNDS